mmetsp:Transcript_33034/g.53645  ORF Transcript_33034/g.53645 Transcript_33034/m.53645 type:complete len:227 (+) Transcript_33034:118-798(+)
MMMDKRRRRMQKRQCRRVLKGGESFSGNVTSKAPTTSNRCANDSGSSNRSTGSSSSRGSSSGSSNSFRRGIRDNDSSSLSISSSSRCSPHHGCNPCNNVEIHSFAQRERGGEEAEMRTTTTTVSSRPPSTPRRRKDRCKLLLPAAPPSPQSTKLQVEDAAAISRREDLNRGPRRITKGAQPIVDAALVIQGAFERVSERHSLRTEARAYNALLSQLILDNRHSNLT